MIRIFADGCCEPNPGGITGWGFAVFDGDRTEIADRRGNCGFGQGMTNNVAEYRAVKEALLWVIEHTEVKGIVEIKTDSQLVLKQVSGEWNANVTHLEELRDEIRALKAQAQRVKLGWIQGIKNVEADALSRLAMHELGVQIHQARLGFHSVSLRGRGLDAILADGNFAIAIDTFTHENLKGAMQAR